MVSQTISRFLGRQDLRFGYDLPSLVGGHAAAGLKKPCDPSMEESQGPIFV
jgi:hypothetical protein